MNPIYIFISVYIIVLLAFLVNYFKPDEQTTLMSKYINSKLLNTPLKKLPSGNSAIDKPYIITPDEDVKYVLTSENKLNILDLNTPKSNEECLALRGVTNQLFKSFNLDCLKFGSGENISFPPITLADDSLDTYLKTVYPLGIFDNLTETTKNNFLDILHFRYKSKFNKLEKNIINDRNGNILYEEERNPMFFNTSHVEVASAVTYPFYKNMNPDTWTGTWYDMVFGTGYFIPTGICAMGYNAVYLLKLFKISPEKILQYSSQEFKKQLNLKGKTIQNVLDICHDIEKYKNEKYNYINFEVGTMKYIAAMAGQKGYKSIQLSNEFDGTIIRHFFIDILDNNLSFIKLIKRNPFSILTNPKKQHWYLNTFNDLNMPQIPDQYIIDPDIDKKFDEFPFKEQCRVAGGAISIYSVYLNCLKIIKFGMPIVNLFQDANKNIDFSIYPKSTTLEKLQSYFTIVYGKGDIWAKQTEEELLERYGYGEIIYLTLVKNLNMQDIPYPLGPRDYIASSIYETNNLHSNNEIYFQAARNKPAESLKYVEVFRNGKIASIVEDNYNFAATFYYPCRGSGYYLPIGKHCVSYNKTTFANSFGVPPGVEITWEQDKLLASNGLFKGLDNLFVVHFASPHVEVIDFKDVISSQMSLIRTHPFDPIVNEPNNDIMLNDPYFTPYLLKSDCILKRQYNGKTDQLCT